MRVGACAAALSGCAPCRPCRHGHTAFIPHAFAPGGAAHCICDKNGAPPKAARVTLRLGLLRQVARKRAVLDAGSSVSGHYEGRFIDYYLALLVKLSHRAFKDSAATYGADVFARHREPDTCLRHSACRSSVYATKPSLPSLFAGRSACTPLSCRESWRGTASLGLIDCNRPAQTISPPPWAASSRDRFFVLPGPPRCYGRLRGAASPPPPTGSQQGRTGATLNS